MVEDLGLLLALFGFDIRMAVPERCCPPEPLDSRLAACVMAICVDKSSKKTSWGYDAGKASGVCPPYAAYIILIVRYGVSVWC